MERNENLLGLQLIDLGFAYRKWEAKDREFFGPVFENFNLSCLPKTNTLLFGSGKTTLCRIICQGIPKYMDGLLKGNILLEGKSILQTPTWDLLQKITYVSQNPQDQIICTSCKDEVAFPLESMGLERELMQEKVSSALKTWALEDKGEQDPQTLSGGEKKRLLLAVATAIDAPIWLLDDVFNELDSKWSLILANFLKAKNKTSLIFASRKTDLLKDLADNEVYLGERAEEEDGYAFSFPLKEPVSSKEISVKNAVIQHGKSFEIRVPSFVLKQGEIVSLLGENGSGKTTFARVLCGLDKAVSGSFEPQNRVSEVPYMFQNPDYQIFLPTVQNELDFSVSGELDNSRLEQTCRDFSLEPNQIASTMNFAGRKMLQGATYSLLNRPFYVLDEADSGLTYAQTALIVEKLRQNGAGLLLITHDRAIASWAHRQYCISNSLVLEVQK